MALRKNKTTDGNGNGISRSSDTWQSIARELVACWTAADDLAELLGGQFVVDFVPEYSRTTDRSDLGHLFHVFADHTHDDMLFVDDRLGPLPSVCAREFRRVARWYEQVADRLEQIPVE